MMDERQEGRKEERKEGKRSRFGKKYGEYSIYCLYHIKSKMISKTFSLFIIFSLREHNSKAINNKVWHIYYILHIKHSH